MKPTPIKAAYVAPGLRIDIEVNDFDRTLNTQRTKNLRIICDPEDRAFFQDHTFVTTWDGRIMLMSNKITKKNFWGKSKGGIRSIPYHLGLPRFTRRLPEFKDSKTDFRKGTYNVKCKVPK